MPQRRRRTYIVAYHNQSKIYNDITDLEAWVMQNGVVAQAFPCALKANQKSFTINGTIPEVSANFNKGKKESPFGNAGIIRERKVFTADTTPIYDGHFTTLGEIIIDEKDVPEEYFISDEQLPKWEYAKGSKSFDRVNKDGFVYKYSEGAMAFPDSLDKPSRTMITGEGGAAPSRFKHVIKTPSGRYRRLVPIELERLNMFPDNHTKEASPLRRAFLMGNALVCGVVEKIGGSLHRFIVDDVVLKPYKKACQKIIFIEKGNMLAV